MADSGYTVAQAYVQIMPSTANFGKSLKNDISTDVTQSGKSAGSSFTSGFKKALGITAAVVSAAAIATGKLAKEAVAAFGEYEQLTGGVEKLFGELSSDAVIANASQAFKTAGLSANDYMETVTNFAAALISSLDGDTKAAVDYADLAIRDMSDNANVFGTDITSIQNAYQGFAKQNYTMLDNLKLGYGGTKSEMERLVLDAENLNSSFKATRDENGNLVLSFADIVEAIHIVQDNMNITGTTATEASTTIQGSINSMKAAWDNLLVGLASGSADVSVLMSDLFGTIFGVEDETGKRVGGVLNNLLPRISSVLTSLGDVMKEYLPTIVGYIPQLLEDILPGLISNATALVEAFVGVLPQIINVVVEQLPLLMTSIGNALITGFESLTENLPSIADSLSGVLASVLAYVSENADTLISAAADFFSTLITEGIEILSENVDGLVSAFLAVIKALVQAAFEHPELIEAIIAMKAISGLGTVIVGALTKGITGGKSTLVKALKWLVSGAVEETAAGAAGAGAAGAAGAGTAGTGLTAGFLGSAALGAIGALGFGAAVSYGMKEWTDYTLRNDESFKNARAAVDEVLEGNNQLVDSYSLLYDQLDGMPTKYEAMGQGMANIDNSGEALIKVLEDSNGSFYTLYRHLGYNAQEAAAMSYETNMLEKDLWETYLAAKEADGGVTDLTAAYQNNETSIWENNVAVDSWSKKLQTAYGANAITGLKSLLTTAEEVGYEVPVTIADSMDANGVSVSDAVAALVELADAGWDMSSPVLTEDTKELLNNILGVVDQNAPEITNKMSKAMIDGEPNVKNAAEGINKTLKGKWDAATLEATRVGTVMTSELSGSMLSGKPQVSTSAIAVAGAVTGAMAGLPSDMSTTGNTSAGNLDSSFGAWAWTVEKTVTKMYNLFKSILGHSLPYDMTIWGSQAGSNFNSGFGDGVYAASGAARSVSQAIENAFGGLYGSMWQYGSWAGEGFYNGLGAWANSIINLARSIANAVTTAIAGALRIGSPSKAMKELGLFTAEGFEIGLQEGTKGILDSATDMVSGVNQIAMDTATLGASGLNQASLRSPDYSGGTLSASSVENYLVAILSAIERASHMQMVTDTGVLVGEMADGMNRQLNAIRIMENRG